MISHGDEQVEEPASKARVRYCGLSQVVDCGIDSQQASSLHLHLHGAAPLERSPAADDQGQVVRPQLRVTLRRVGVRVPRAREDGAALDAGL